LFLFVGLTSLRSLDISGTYITDVSPLAKLTNLKLLDFRDPKASPSKVSIQTLVDTFEKVKKDKTTKEGWLTKQGGRIKTWKKRFMVMTFFK
jgi:Leucine-rich repeat (LRR) protein